MHLAYREMSILLVDSVSVALDTLENFLKEFDFHRVWTARGAEEAQKLLGEKPVDLMITAARLQPVSGFQLVEMVRKNPLCKGLLVLVMVEERDKIMAAKAMEAGAEGVILLPLRTKQVMEAVDGLLETLVDQGQEEYLKNLDAARKAYRKGKYQMAVAAFKAAAAQDASEGAMMGLARSLSKLGNLDDAETAFMEGIRIHKKSLRGFMGLAEVYQRQFETEKALKVLRVALGLARSLKESGVTQASILFYIGEIELRLQRMQEALGHFRQAADLAPEDASLPEQIGDSLTSEDFLAESEEFYQRALELDPSKAHVYNRLGMAYRRQGKYDLTLDLYRQALSFHPEDENLYYNIGRCYWDMQEHKKSAEKLAVALRLNPEFSEAKRLLDAVLQKLGLKVGSEEALKMLGDLS